MGKRSGGGADRRDGRPVRRRSVSPPSVLTFLSMDALRRDDVEYMRKTPLPEKAKLVFELMQFGFDLKRANLRNRRPEATDEEIDQDFRRWLARDE